MQYLPVLLKSAIRVDLVWVLHLPIFLLSRPCVPCVEETANDSISECPDSLGILG